MTYTFTGIATGRSGSWVAEGLVGDDVASGSVQIPTDDGGGTLSFTMTNIVPEPGTGLLLGLVGLAARRRR